MRVPSIPPVAFRVPLWPKYRRPSQPIREGARSADLILRCARNGVIPVQVLGEYLRFVQRRVPAAFDGAIRQVALYHAVFLTPPTTFEIIDRASTLALAHHHLQLWDCVICVAAAQAGAKVLLTEDMQDGRVLDELRLVNPFAPANAETIDTLLE